MGDGRTGAGPDVKPADALPDDLAGESRFQLLTRLGFAGRGLLYIVIGLLVILTGRTEDLTGALEYFGDGLGKLLLAVLAAGMAVYGLWRLTDAAFGIESGRHHWKAWRKRIAAATSGIIYSFLAWKAVKILLAERVSGGEPRDQAAEALSLPGGELIVLIAAGILLGRARATGQGGELQLPQAARVRRAPKGLDQVAGTGWLFGARADLHGRCLPPCAIVPSAKRSRGGRARASTRFLLA